MSVKRIGVSGGGPAGMSTAILLSQKGFNVEIFEKHESPKPVGAGIMVQPTGLKVLEEIGISEAVINNGQQIIGIDGIDHLNRSIFDFEFGLEGLFGIGVHRTSLFSNLYSKCIELGIPYNFNFNATDITKKENKIKVITKTGESTDYFDLLVVANGRSSELRKYSNNVKKDTQQPYGAIWTKVKQPKKEFPNKIYHVYKGTQKMLGVMPIGFSDNNHNSDSQTNLFCGVGNSILKKWEASYFNEWMDDNYKMAPNMTPILNQITSFDDLTLAPYYDVFMSNLVVEDNLVFVGDAGHAMSPHLSSGTNMALLDAKVLADCMGEFKLNSDALASFKNKRMKQLKHYIYLSRVITPLFQSERDFSFIRDNIAKHVLSIPIFKNIMIKTVMGVKTGIFSNMDSKYYK